MKLLLRILMVFTCVFLIVRCKKKEETPLPVAETCSDGIQNQDETGIDCGGSCMKNGQVIPCGPFQYISNPFYNQWCTDSENALWYLDANTAFIVSGKNNGHDGTIQKSNDGGTTWSEIKQTTNPLYTIFFVSSSTGFVGGDGGAYLKTTDGGLTWNESIIYPNNDTLPVIGKLKQIYFTDAGKGFIIGEGGSGYLKTTDSGNTWQAIAQIPSLYQYESKKIQTINNNIWMLCEPTAPGFYRSYNNGLNWLFIHYNIPNITTVQNLFIVDGYIGYLIASRNSPLKYIVFKTIDGGTTWAEMSTINGSAAYGIEFNMLFINQNEGWITSFNGADNSPRYLYISHTTDGGSSWEVNSILHDNHCQNYPAFISSVFYLSPSFYCLTADGYIIKK